jgi:hypothetical protein
MIMDEINAIWNELSPAKRELLLDFTRFLLEKENDQRWESILSDPKPRPRLDAKLTGDGGLRNGKSLKSASSDSDIRCLTLSSMRNGRIDLNALQAEVDSLKRLQAETAAELDALLPAVLDRAFKGEL